MFNFILLRQLFIALLLTALGAFSAQGQDLKYTLKFRLRNGIQDREYLPNTVIVKLKRDDFKKRTAGMNLKSLFDLKTAKIAEIASKFPEVESNAKRSLSTTVGDLSTIYELKLSGTPKIEDVINELLLNNMVEYAEPSYIHHLKYIPNDTYLSNQSYLAQVKAFESWNIRKNSSDVVIAIVDSGSELNHEDIAGNVFVNHLDPINGIDDDGDGYIDNYYGWDFAGANGNSLKEDSDPGVKNKSLEHGIHVSGLASSVSDNNIGLASIAFNAKLLIVKVAADDNATSIYKGYEGIKYAADHGAHIINCSWGGKDGGQFGRDVINYAIEKGCLIVAAAGNDNTSAPDYPAAYPGVLAVASVNSSDMRSPTSNYGTHVSLSAPGVNILSTVFANAYNVMSGTSMATPIVSSAAALLKSQFPSLSMAQIGQRLRVAADNIEDKNPLFKGQLGTGRLNVYRCLTETTPAVRTQKITMTDGGNETYLAGDTVELFIDLKNFLEPADNLKLKLFGSSSFVKILNPEYGVGKLSGLESKTGVGPFYIYIMPGIPDNEKVLFRIDYSANNGLYSDTEYFSRVVSLGYLNIRVNKVSTSLTGNGKVGYSLPNAANGLGFEYKGEQLLYEASLLIGNGPLKISNNARNTLNDADNHFIRKEVIRQIKNSSTDFEGVSAFDDSGNSNALNVLVKHRQLAYSEPPYDKFTIAEYEIFNNNQISLNNVFAGLFTDWDIEPNALDITKYDSAERLAYQYGKFGGTPVAAVKLLTSALQPAYYPMNGTSEGDFLENGEFTLAEKFKSISSGIKALEENRNNANDADIAFSSGYGPFFIPAGKSVKVAFALIAGDNLDDVLNSAHAAQEKYNSIDNSVVASVDKPIILKPIYPNPVYGTSQIEFSISTEGFTTLEIYDSIGRKIKSLLGKKLDAGDYAIEVNGADFAEGVYIYQLRNNAHSKALKMLVVK